jgi:predicted regulator of Ras-like GTPase activity (Roadblock/LC7/MglB family)
VRLLAKIDVSAPKAAAAPRVSGPPPAAPVSAPVPAPSPAPEPVASPAAKLGLEMQARVSALRGMGGLIGACLVDAGSGLVLAGEGDGSLDLEAVAGLNTEVVRAEMQVIAMLGLEDQVEEILITMGRQLHMIRPLRDDPSMFLYVALEKASANLGMARLQLRRVEEMFAG